jgi:hypothetical protein
LTSITIMPETPTPAMAEGPSLPTQIMSMVGPIMLRLPPIIIGQPSDSRLPTVLPFVQSLVTRVPLVERLLPSAAVDNKPIPYYYLGEM